MTYQVFAGRLIVALLLASIIGFERQWRQRLAGLRTNALVGSGSALFVMLATATPHPDFTHIAGQVVTGIGFLGAGVIMHEGLNVRGLNTAATLWCVAAVGSLAGTGMLVEATLGALGVLAANVLLKPVADRLRRVPVDTAREEAQYVLRLTSQSSEEIHVRALLIQEIEQVHLVLSGLHSKDLDANRVEVTATLRSMGRNDALLEQMVGRLSLEQGVTSVAWEVAPILEE